MNRIQSLYFALITMNLVGATSCTASTLLNTTSSPYSTMMIIVNGMLAAVNLFLVWFNFGQMNKILQRNGFEPVTLDSIKRKLPPIPKWLQK